MATINDTIRPGDIISSDLMNRIIAMLNDHEAKLAAAGPGGSSANIISGFVPDAAVGQNVNKTLTMFGSFDFPLSGNMLSIDGLPIAPAAFLSGSNNTQILFVIPASIVVQVGTTKSVVVRVVNSKGVGERTYLLLPQQAAAQPDPTITTVLDIATSNSTLVTTQKAKINGLNFASPASNNKVRLIFNPGPSQTAFPPNQGDSLAIDMAASIINAAPQESSLVVTMPTVVAPQIPTVGPPVSVHLEVTATGANNVAGKDINIRRAS